MKKIFITIAALVCLNVIAAAQQKTSWTFSAKKLAAGKYELHMTATPPAGWHIYSQNTPEGGPIPTSFTFNNNALVTLSGNVKETGKTVKYFDKNFKVNVIYFEGKVDFVQVVTVKGKIKTNVSGEVESMMCNDRTCMPSVSEKFNIALN